MKTEEREVIFQRLERDSDISQWQEFAASFNHHLNLRHDIVGVRLEGRPVGWFQVIPRHCCYPAYHPGMLSKREYFHVATESARAAFHCLQAPLIVTPYKDAVKLSSERLMARCGLYKLDYHIFEPRFPDT
jgi:hypothetical protein